MPRDWEGCYRNDDTPWDKGYAAPPLLELIETLGAEVFGKGEVLVPGCGMGHDVRAISALGIGVLGLDLSETAVARASACPRVGSERYELGDFLDPEWGAERRFSAIWEHTCFCAIDPEMRDAYAAAAAALLGPGGMLCGVFYLSPYDPGEERDGPPFETSIEEIDQRFSGAFEQVAGWVPKSSYAGREGREWIGVFDGKTSRGLSDRHRRFSMSLLFTMMRLGLLMSLVLSGLASTLAGEGRPYFNDKKAPEDSRDLMAIQSALQNALPAAREATVCIELGGGSGTGVIVSEDGLILTAAHVSTGVGKKLKVVMEDGSKHDATSLGLVSDTDAAMIRLNGKGPWPFSPMDREGSTRLGDWVFSIGHSGGFDKNRGSVVRLGRMVRMAQTTWQSDCTLIGGDSGGPLFDLTGKLIGIHSRVGQQLGVNMHVPMSEYLVNWDAMLKNEFIGDGPFAKKPVKGSGLLGIATEAAEGGLRVIKVGKGTPAETAGVKDGDLITRFNDKAFATREELQAALREMAAGDPVTLVIVRDGQEKTLTFELDER